MPIILNSLKFFIVFLSIIIWPLNASEFNTTYERFLERALSGDTEAQNMLGYMSFYGEAAKQSYDEAHHWFHLSAEAGNVKAQRNLGLFHARALDRIPKEYYDPEESNIWLMKAQSNAPQVNISQLSNKIKNNIESLSSGSSREIGETIYQSLCGGCHGYDGMATYNKSPSFRLGERLEKNDATLLSSIANGMNVMPAWKSVLSKQQMMDVLEYIRTNLAKARNESYGILDKNKSKGFASVSESLGQNTYAKFCAGCHGFSGIAYYVNSPSFALGERMDKSNSALRKSIAKGINVMPGWESMLSREEISALVEYIRTLALDFNVGIDREINSPVSRYYKFKPKDGH